jgi:hypothetical protein
MERLLRCKEEEGPAPVCRTHGECRRSGIPVRRLPLRTRRTRGKEPRPTTCGRVRGPTGPFTSAALPVQRASADDRKVAPRPQRGVFPRREARSSKHATVLAPPTGPGSNRTCAYDYWFGLAESILTGHLGANHKSPATKTWAFLDMSGRVASRAGHALVE